MILGALRGNGLMGNVIFDRTSPANRDDCFAPYVLLRDRLHQIGIQIDTVDKSQCQGLGFELHQDVQHATKAMINYLLMFETEFVKAENADVTQLSLYRKIFTWNDDLVDGDRFIKINFPNPIQVYAADGFSSSRDKFVCLISSNRTLPVQDDRNLYPERVKV